ncbi:MAG TPA: hypothetical protein VK846_12005 [Candidatus Limnocylindria bacterium]|nr:hypothetical protein [Candidatus Limnocylindria bacterium]
MKIRRSVILFCAVAIVLIALLVWFGKRPRETVSVEPVTATNPAVAETSETTFPERNESAPARSRKVQRSNPAGTNFAASVPPPVPDDPRHTLAVLNDVPIVFYGKLEDQFRNPVSGADVTGNTIIYNGTKSGSMVVSTTSDANGFFQINAGKGESLGIMPKKQGYALATKGTEFKYSYMYQERFEPDPRNPVVVKMWKLQGAEPLIGIDKEYKLPFPDRPIFFDLVAGRLVENGGDLEIIITRAAGSLSKKNPGDWSIELKPINGGIIESDYHTAGVTFKAPPDGYQNSYLVQMNSDNPAWFDNIQKMFFVKSRGGQVYSKLNLDFGINREPTDSIWVQFKGIATPMVLATGRKHSRNENLMQANRNRSFSGSALLRHCCSGGGNESCRRHSLHAADKLLSDAAE